MQRRSVFNGLLALGAGLALSMAMAGCSQLPGVATGAARSPDFNGRMALQTGARPGHPAQAFSAQFELSGDDQHGRLRLLSPLGTTLADASWSPEQVTLTSDKGTQYFASLAELSEESMGEPLPLNALLYWLAGKPWPGALALANDSGFSQLGWQIEPGQLSAEGLLVARREAPTPVLLRVRLEH